MHTDCSIHTGTSDARCVQVFKRYIYALHSRHSFAHFTAIRRQEFSKYNTPQTTPSICSTLSTLICSSSSQSFDVRNPPSITLHRLRLACWGDSLPFPKSKTAELQVESKVHLVEQALQTLYTNQRSRSRSEEITVQVEYCMGGGHTNTDRPKTHDYIRFHRHKTHWEVTNQCHKSNHKLSCAPANQITSLTLNQSSIAIVGTSM